MRAGFLRTALLAALFLPGTARAQSQDDVERKIRAILKAVRVALESSSLKEDDARRRLERIVDDPKLCAAKTDDKYCRVYERVLKDKPGLRPEDVFAAFSADEILDNGLPQSVGGCSGDSRVFLKFAARAGLKVKRFGASVRIDYIKACYDGAGKKLEKAKDGAHLDGHAGAVVQWEGKWRLLDTSGYDRLNYARDGAGKIVAEADPSSFPGREVYFGFDNDPYIVTNVDDDLDRAYTYRQIENVGVSGSPRSSACGFKAGAEAVKDWSDCRFKGRTAFDDGASMDFGCGSCYVHRSRETGFSPDVGQTCSFVPHKSNGRGPLKDCVCVRCGGKGQAFYDGGCDRAR